jgi:hypothetical protein
MNKLTTLLVVVIMALSFTLGTTMPSKAQNKSFVGILPFMSDNGRVGFLDQNNGRVYLYDNNISQCLFVGQIQNLGQPIQVISANSANSITTQ